MTGDTVDGPMQIKVLPGMSCDRFLLPRINRANVEQ